MPDELRKSVCFLGIKTNPSREPAIKGTAFFVAVVVDQLRNCVEYIVTAAHCLDVASKESCDASVHLRFNTNDGGFSYLPVAVDKWVRHPGGDKYDIAVLPVKSIPENWDHASLELDDFSVNDPSVKMGLGDTVSIIGLFKHYTGSKRNIPIVRTGNVAALPDEPIPTKDYGMIEGFLIEARSIGGLSGSPVFFRSDHGAQFLWKSPDWRAPGAYLCGLIHGHWDEPHADATQDAGEAVNSGIAVVVPIKAIADILQLPEFVAGREAVKAEIERNRPAVTAD